LARLRRESTFLLGAEHFVGQIKVVIHSHKMSWLWLSLASGRRRGPSSRASGFDEESRTTTFGDFFRDLASRRLLRTAALACPIGMYFKRGRYVRLLRLILLRLCAGILFDTVQVDATS